VNRGRDRISGSNRSSARFSVSAGVRGRSCDGSRLDNLFTRSDGAGATDLSPSLPLALPLSLNLTLQTDNIRQDLTGDEFDVNRRIAC